MCSLSLHRPSIRQSCILSWPIMCLYFPFLLSFDLITNSYSTAFEQTHGHDPLLLGDKEVALGTRRKWPQLQVIAMLSVHHIQKGLLFIKPPLLNNQDGGLLSSLLAKLKDSSLSYRSSFFPLSGRFKTLKQANPHS